MLHADWLAARAALHPQREALSHRATGERRTYAALHDRASRAAAALAARGVGAGDRVALHARNAIDSVELLFAAGRLGAILVPINWRLADREVAQILADAEPALILADAPGASQLAVLGAVAVSLDDWRSEVGARAPVSAPLPGDDAPWLLLYTSGSTGAPKGAILTHGTIGWNAINTAVGWGLGPTDRTITAAPFFHTGGWNVLTIPLLYVGGSVVLDDAFDAGRTLRAIEHEGVTVWFGVPTMVQALVEHPRWAEADLTGLRWAVSGGAPCARPLFDAVAARGVDFRQGFGLTEVGPNCFMLPPGGGLAAPDAVGVPVPHLRVRVVDEAGRDVPTGDVGELELAGPTVTPGYWRRPGATEDALRDGWFRTGDLFRVGQDGWFRCVGRRKEMFISGGENVYPVEVERVLAGLPGVSMAAVVAAPHPRWGEVGHAFVALRADAPSFDEAGARALCRAELAGYKVPYRITVLPELPLQGAGKIDKRSLAERARAEAG